MCSSGWSSRRRSKVATHGVVRPVPWVPLADGASSVYSVGVKECAMNAPAQASLFFFTFHPCASVFFSRFVLQRARGLVHVDFAGRQHDLRACSSLFNGGSKERL